MESLEKVNTDYQNQLNDWIKHEKAALDLIGFAINYTTEARAR
jgi:hypothetical protein